MAGSVLASILLGENTSVLVAALVSFVVGIGLGLSASPTLVAAQTVVGWARRGVVTGTNMFSRSLGSVVGATLFGAIANATLASRFANPPSGIATQLPDSVDATSLVLGGHTGAGNAVVSGYIRASLQAASQHVFLAMALLAVIGVGALLLMPRRTQPITAE